jgi:hypothetical protein
MPLKTIWAWGEGEECEIRDSEIWMGRMDPGGGNGASCSLREFLDGKYTWHLPDDVRREALAAVQEILGDARPLPDAVRRGDQSRLDPETRAAAKRIARADRAAKVENARLAKQLTRKDLPDRRRHACDTCLALAAESGWGQAIGADLPPDPPGELDGPGAAA